MNFGYKIYRPLEELAYEYKQGGGVISDTERTIVKGGKCQQIQDAR